MELELDLLGTATGLLERCCKEKGYLRKVFRRARFERQNFVVQLFLQQLDWAQCAQVIFDSGVAKSKTSFMVFYYNMVRVMFVDLRCVIVLVEAVEACWRVAGGSGGWLVMLGS